MVLGVFGCAIQERKDQATIRTFFKNREYAKALEALEESTLKKENKNRLLYLMEKGRIHFSQGYYAQASDLFYEANELVDKLYTKKITQKILSSIGNDNSENYYGSILERSMLYYYLALSNLQIYRQGFVQKKEMSEANDKKEKKKSKWTKRQLSPSEAREYLFRARAAVLAWNGFFEEVRRVNTETTLYQSDLMGKLFAASIHELVAERTDMNIALQLYKDALKILVVQGPSYKQFNTKFADYSKEIYSQLTDNKVNPKAEWIEATGEYQKALDFIHYKILALTRKYRSREYKKELKKLTPSQWVLSMLEEKQLPNITVLIEQSVTNPMEPQEFDYSLNSAIENIEDPTTRTLVEGIGLPVLTLFAMGPLGLGYATQTGNTYIYTQHNLGTEVMRHIGIGFEMPIVKEVPLEQPMVLHFYRKDEKNKKLVTSLPLAITGPINDLAMQAASERAAASYTKVGVRVALKHLVAILAAYRTYETMKEANGEFLARGIAFTQYMASTKGIKASEQADVRFWSTLPSNIRQGTLYLPAGTYLVTRSNPAVENSEKELGQIEVSDGGMNFFSYRL